jgi:hypothetical protein
MIEATAYGQREHLLQELEAGDRKALEEGLRALRVKAKRGEVPLRSFYGFYHRKCTELAALVASEKSPAARVRRIRDVFEREFGMRLFDGEPPPSPPRGEGQGQPGDASPPDPPRRAP